MAGKGKKLVEVWLYLCSPLSREFMYLLKIRDGENYTKVSMYITAFAALRVRYDEIGFYSEVLWE